MDTEASWEMAYAAGRPQSKHTVAQNGW